MKRFLSILTILILTLSFSSQAWGQKTFVGGNGKGATDWNDKNNWDPKGVPGEWEKVIINANCDIPGDLLRGESITVNAGATLTINGNLSLNNGNNTLQVSGTVNVTGNVIANVSVLAGGNLNVGGNINCGGNGWGNFTLYGTAVVGGELRANNFDVNASTADLTIDATKIRDGNNVDKSGNFQSLIDAGKVHEPGGSGAGSGS